MKDVNRNRRLQLRSLRAYTPFRQNRAGLSGEKQQHSMDLDNNF